MRLGLTYDLQTDQRDPRQAEFDPPATVDALEQALISFGHHVARLGSARDVLASPGNARSVDVVFNIAEGSHGRCREAWVPMLLERWGVPFVGSAHLAQSLALDKAMTKRLLDASGIPTPRWATVERVEDLARASALRFPMIVKPRYEGSGIGIDAGAIVHDADELERRAAWIMSRLGEPCVVEEVVPFGELTVLLIGNGPPEALPAIQRPLDPHSRLSVHVIPGGAARSVLSPVELTARLDGEAGRLAVEVFELIGCRDVARVDFRVGEDGALFVLEINPLPSFDPDGTVGLMAEYLGVPYAAVIGRILEAATRRLETAPRRCGEP